jgi:hypothetical protein
MPIPDDLDQQIRTAAFIHVRRMIYFSRSCITRLSTIT